ncbi:MAG: hypothetical protein AB8G23_15560 [Myxococcota bacterium]
MSADSPDEARGRESAAEEPRNAEAGTEWDALRHAFGETVDSAGYVPRMATESLFSSVDQWRSQDVIGSTLAALVTQPGLGKTFFLRMVEQRINLEASAAGKSARALYLPYAGVSAVDLCILVYGLLGLQSPLADTSDASGEAVLALEALFDLSGGPADPFFLLLDDADSMPEETVQVLGQVLPAERSPLRILVALGDDARSSQLLETLDSLEPSVAILRATLSEEETALYLEAKVRQSGISQAALERIGGLEAEQVSWVRTLSGGVPREIHRVITALIDSHVQGRPMGVMAQAQQADSAADPIEDDLSSSEA